MSMETIYLAAGCFWGAQRYFDCQSGVIKTTVGYANGNTAFPTYEQVKHENTGHAETVKIEFDSDKLPLSRLLEIYFDVIDPTSVNRQGADKGVQYRTGIYYTTSVQREVAEAALKDLQKRYDKPIAVELRPIENFYDAEEYHQNYLVKNPSGYCHIPKDKFKDRNGGGR